MGGSPAQLLDEGIRLSDLAASIPAPASPGGPRRASALSPRVGLLLGAFLAALTTFTPYLLLRDLPMWIDEGIFAYMARTSARENLPLYHGALDNKPPGVFWLYEAVAAYDFPGVQRARLTEAALLFLAALLLLVWVGREVSWLAGIVAAAGLGVLAFMGTVTYALTEPPMILLTTLAFWLTWRGAKTRRAWPFLVAGLALAAAFTCKQIAVLDGLAALLFLALSPDLLPGWRLRSVLLLSAGFALGLLALTAGMVATHQFPGFWHSTVGILLGGASTLTPGERPARLLDLLLLAPWRLPLALALAAALAPLAPRFSPLRRLGVIWLLFTFAGFLGPSYASIHQTLPFLPPLCLLTGLACVWLAGLSSAPLTRAVFAPLLLLVVWSQPLYGYQSRIQARLEGLHAHPPSHLPALGRWLEAHLPPGATIQSVGKDTPLYVYSGRRAASRYPYPGWNNDALTQVTLRDLEHSPPAALILTPSEYAPELRLLRAVRAWPGLRHYRRVPNPTPGDYELWLRSDLTLHP